VQANTTDRASWSPRRPPHSHRAIRFTRSSRRCSPRVEQRIANTADDAPLPDELVARIDELDRIPRYKVDRMMVAVSAFAPIAIDAFTMFSRFMRTPAAPTSVALPDLPLADAIDAVASIHPQRMHEKAYTIAAMARGTTSMPIDRADTIISRLIELFVDITDELNTNTHYCWSVLHFVDALVSAIAERPRTA
jgi:hypothetical protein